MLALAFLLAALHPAPVAALPVTGPTPGVPAPPSERVHPTVTPRAGGTRTQFRLTLTARLTLSTGPGVRSYYALAINGPAECGGRDDASSTITSARAGQHVTVPLRPGAAEWCTGEHTVTVTLVRQIVCRRGEACPAIAFAPLTVGTARFKVVLSGARSKHPPRAKRSPHSKHPARSRHAPRSQTAPPGRALELTHRESRAAPAGAAT